MDYDDNDFQSQNLQLAGESSNNFPPVLRPYALPKFDFDDNLHGSLRYDSLVETEVFLGIESNEDSQWIEDFSRGSGGIQFNSSAPESCSIPLRNNVWSEATSSESVEMLLKSVGQEELILAQTKESDACDELGCIIKRMEPNLKQNSNIATRVENFKDLQPALLPVQFPGEVGLDDNGGGQQSQIEDISQSGAHTSVDQGLGDLTAISVEFRLPVAGKSSFIDKCDNNDEIEVDNAVNESLDNRVQESSASGTEVDNVVATVQNIGQGNDEMDNKDASDNVMETADEELDISGTDECQHHEKGDVSEGFQMHVHPNEEVFGSGPSHLDNPLSLSPMESIKENMCSVGEQGVIPMEDSGIEMCHQSSVDTHEASLVVPKVSSDNRDEVEDFNRSHLDKDIVSKTVPSLLSIGDNKGSEDKVDGKFISFGAVNCSSSELCGETNAEGHVPSSMMVENIQMCEKDVSGPDDVTGVDKCVSVEQKKNIELPSTIDSDIDGIHDEGVHTSSFSEGSRGELVVSKSESHSMDGDESANGVPVPSENDITKDTVCELKVEAIPLSTVFTCLDTHKKIAAESSAEASLTDLKAAPEVTTGADSVSDFKEGSAVVAEQMAGKSANQLALDACDAENQIESHSVVTEKINEESIKDKDVTVPACDSTADKQASIEVQIKGKINDENEKEHVNVSDPAIEVKMPEPVPLSMMESSQATVGKVQEEVEASEDLKVEQIAVPSTNVEQEGSAVLDNPASDSPTVIISSQPYDEKNNEGVKTLSYQSSLVTADKVQSASPLLNKTDPSKDDGSFSFQVTPTAVKPRKNSKKRHASSSVEASRPLVIVDASTPSGLGQSEPKAALDLSHGSPKASDVAVVVSGSKGNTERKPRRASSKATPKDTAKKRSSARETTSMKLDRGDKMTGVSPSSSGVSQLVQSNEIQRFGNLNSNSLKPFVLSASTAGLPDLNSSVSPAAVFHQPFSDLQQVQLRAQIFVYGALIQGTAPDEAYMISAFGGPDGGRSIWENSWRSCIERLHGHKSHLTPETPLQSRSGTKAPEQSIKHGALQSKVVSSPIGRGSSKGTPTIASPIVPFSSPLWTVSTPGDTLQPSSMPRGPVVDYHRALSPLHPHQTPGIRNFVGHSPSWLSQAPYGSPWMASPQNSTLETSGRFSVQFPIAETVQPTHVKETSVHHSSAMKPACPPAQNAASTGVIAGSSSMLNAKIVTSSGSQPSIDPKPRKRKKNSISDNIAQNVLPSQSQTEPVTASVVASPLSTSVALTTPISFVSKGPAEKLITSTIPRPADILKGDQTSEQKSILSEETLGKVEDAKVQAEDAAASAASAVSHSQQVWDQLEKQKNAGLLPDAEAKLASAAVAIAAAAAVAKAAAAAAKVASNTALQAKLMAEEAVASGYTNASQMNVISFHDGMINLGKATPASILKGDDRTSSSSSFLVAAREATKKRVEAASAATKQAENMDAIVKAAELAAEAVSQAGKIVAMGDPMPLSELVAAGPEGYWKAATPEMIWRSSDTDMENRNINSGREDPNTLMRQLKEVPSEKKENHITSHGNPPAPREMYSEDQERVTEGLPGFGVTMMKEAKVQKGRRASDLAKAIGVVPESGNGSRSSIVPNEPEKEQTSQENNIKEHSLVEVYKDGNGCKAAWYPANVISLKEGKAFVEYSVLVLDEGSEKLKEWVPLEGNEDEAPKIRIARPPIMLFEGTRKRRRSAMADHVWSIGDRVDACIEESWREGVVTEKNNDSLLTVTFPARGEILVLPSTQLHPSRVWKDRKWVDWSSLGDKNRVSHGGDTPNEKRPRVRSPVAENRGKDKASRSVDAVESDKSDDPTLLALSTDEKQFNVGKSSRFEHRTDTTRMPRTGLQKEGSRVVFGVPKPGKKRKFMDVSQHYEGDRSGQMNEANDSLKFTKYLMPQGSGSRTWKSSRSETNDKRAAISKPKVLKSGKPQNVSGRTIPHKNNLSNAAVSVPDSSAVTKESVNDTDNTSEKQNTTAFHSASGRAPEAPVVFSARAPQSGTVPSKRMHTTIAKPERVSKGRLAPASSRLEKIEEGKSLNGNSSARSTSDSTEPRRSNRRIQPTSRLLEGLQSSLMVSKIPSISHDKSQKSRTASSSRGHNQG